MSDAGVLRGVAYHANGHPRHDPARGVDGTCWWSKQGPLLRRFDPAAENASSPPMPRVKYGAEGAVVSPIVERDGVPDLVEVAAAKGGARVGEAGPGARRHGCDASHPSACVESNRTRFRENHFQHKNEDGVRARIRKLVWERRLMTPGRGRRFAHSSRRVTIRAIHLPLVRIGDRDPSCRTCLAPSPTGSSREAMGVPTRAAPPPRRCPAPFSRSRSPIRSRSRRTPLGG